MTKREEEIIKLLQQNNWIKGKDLAVILSVSDRTIRNDIKNINLELGYKAIISDKNLGYKLSNKNIIKDIKNKKIDSVKERRSYILKKLLTSKTDLDLYDITDNLYVSETTVVNDINDLNVFLENYHNLKIDKKNNKIGLRGREKDIRKLYKDLLIEETKNNLFNINQIASLYEKFDLIVVMDILEKILKKYNYKINEVAFPLLMIHLGVSIDRILSNEVIDIEYESEIKNKIEFKIAKEFFKEVKNRIDIEINEPELVLFSKNLITKNSNKKDFLVKSKKYELLVKDLLDYIYENYDINFLNDDKLIDGLCLHIEALISRNKQKVKTANPFLDEIKKRYSYLFELSIIAIDYLNNNLDLEINDDEASFICLHLSTAYERNFNKRYKAILISPEVSIVNERLKESINNNFSEKIEIIKILDYFQEEKVKNLNPDLLISTVGLNHSLDIKTSYISPFFKIKDETNLLKTIKYLDDEKLKKGYEIYLRSIIKPENFYVGLEFKNRVEVIKFLCENLEKKSYVSKDYLENVLKREEISDTSFSQGFSIPHSLDTLDIKKSAISIIILKNPMIWGNHKVQIIFLLTIKNANSKALELFFSWMYTISNDLENFSKLIKSKSFGEFIKFFSYKQWSYTIFQKFNNKI